MSGEAILSIDIGGKSIKVGYVDSQGLIKARRPTPLPESLDTDTVSHLLKEQVEKGLCEASREKLHIVAVGVGSPGGVDRERGLVREATNLALHDFRLKEFVEKCSGKPTFVEHDVRSGAIAERQFGALRGVDDFLYIAIGTGIGAAIAVHGKLHYGITGLAGEVGHMVVVPHGRECGCGRRGCLEAYCSAKHIELRYQEQTGSLVSCAEIAERALSGESFANEIWNDAMEALAYALVNCHTLLDTAVIVIGGGVAAAGEKLLLQPLVSKMREIAPDMSLPVMRFSELHEHSALIGAGYQALARYSNQEGDKN